MLNNKELAGLRCQLQDDLLRTVGGDIKPIMRAIEAILGSNNGLEADEGMVGRSNGLGPDLHGCQQIVLVLWRLSDRQGAVARNAYSNAVWEGVWIIRRLSIPLECRNVEARGAIG